MLDVGRNLLKLVSMKLNKTSIYNFILTQVLYTGNIFFQKNLWITIRIFFVYQRTRELQAYIQLLRSAKSLRLMARQAVLFMTTYIKEWNHLYIRNINIIKWYLLKIKIVSRIRDCRCQILPLIIFGEL